MLTLTDVSCRREGKLLFSQVSFVMHAGQKVGLTGSNGTGKSTLFDMVLGNLEPDEGELALQQQIRVTHVAQETPATERTALDYVIDGDRPYRALQKAIENCGDEQGEQLGSLHIELEQIDGYSIHARAGALLNGLGFAGSLHQQPVSSFSGGWRMRLNLAQALISPSELLLLDEPTNHLDLDAVFWLESWLRQRPGSLMLISHDQEFLDAVTSSTLNIDSGQITLYSGNYSAFERWNAERQISQQALHEKTQARKRELQGFVDRFRAKASKARQAQSRLKMLERLGETQAVRSKSAFSFRFQAPRDLPDPLLVMQGVSVGYPDKLVLKDVNLSIQSGDRIGLLGANGAGKSTLVKALVGELALMDGSRTPAHKLSVGYFAQHQVDRLRSDQSALQALLTQDPQMSESQARSFLGSYGFEGDRALQRADTLSGGERARLALALIVQARPNFLLLDEPTNHLDIGMRQALSDALLSFEGALLVISHDRTMLRNVVDELWLIADQQISPFDDDLDGYARWLAQQRQVTDQALPCTPAGTAKEAPGKHGRPDDVSVTSVNRREQKRAEARQRAQLSPLTRAVNQSETDLDQATAALAEIRDKLGDEGLYQDPSAEDLNTLLKQEAEARLRVDRAEEKLLECMDALEQAQRRIRVE